MHYNKLAEKPRVAHDNPSPNHYSRKVTPNHETSVIRRDFAESAHAAFVPALSLQRISDAQKSDMNAVQTTICALKAAARALRSCT